MNWKRSFVRMGGGRTIGSFFCCCCCDHQPPTCKFNLYTKQCLSSTSSSSSFASSNMYIIWLLYLFIHTVRLYITSAFRVDILCILYWHEMNEWTTHNVTWCDFLGSWLLVFLYAAKLEFGYYIIIRFKGNSTLCVQNMSEWVGWW